MNAHNDSQNKIDAQLFDLLERPEDWPEDPEAQAELAGLLELHLALHSHVAALPAAPSNRPWFRTTMPWLLSAAALLAIVPSILAVQHIRLVQAEAKDRAHLERVAMRRGEGRLWAAFFEQSRELLVRFEKEPPVCQANREDRNEERVLALALLQASHQLAGQQAPGPEAAQARNELHAWLTELSLEEGCLTSERVKELRQVAQTQDLQAQARKLGDLLKGEGS